MGKFDKLAQQGVYFRPLAEDAPAEAKKNEQGDFSRGFEKSMLQIPQTLGGAAALVGDLTGSDGLRDYGLGVYEKNSEKINAITKDTDSLSNVMEGTGDANAVDWVQNNLGYVGGQALSAVATGGVGGFIGKQLAMRGIKDVAARGATSAAAKQVVAKVGARGAMVGAGTALFGNNLAQEAGSIYPEALATAHEEGRELDGGDKARVVGASLAAAGVDTAMDALMMGRVLAGGRKALLDSAGKPMRDAAGRAMHEGIGRAAMREIPGGMARETVTEGIQTGIERWGAQKELGTADAIREYVDSMGVGALGGAAGGSLAILHGQKVQESGPLTRAANTSIDNQILQLTHDPDPFIVFPDGTVGKKAEMEAYLTQFPEENGARSEARAKLMGLGPQENKPEPLASTPEAEAATLASWGQNHDGMALDYVQSLVRSPGAKDLKLMVVPHPSGKLYTAVPSKWLSLDSQARFGALQKGDQGMLPGPDREAPGGAIRVDAEGGAAPETYGEQVRTGQRERDQQTADELIAKRQRELGKPAPHGPRQQAARGVIPTLTDKVAPAAPAKQDDGIPTLTDRIGQGDEIPTLTDVLAPPDGIPVLTDRIDDIPTLTDIIQPATVLNPKGEPFKSEFAAKRRAKEENLGESHVVQPVQGGFVLQPKEATDAAAAGTDTGSDERGRSTGPAGANGTGDARAVSPDDSVPGPAGDPAAVDGTPVAAAVAATPAAADHDPAVIEQAAHEAATSPRNDLPEPTQAQKDAGNYPKGHTRVHGLDITIENPAGSVRRGVAPDGKAWENELAHHYGYIKRTTGADGDHVDTFIGPNPNSDRVYVVNQVDPKTGKWDEHKVLIGFDSMEEAQAGYAANYEKGWQGGKDIVETSAAGFKAWLTAGNTTRPFVARKRSAEWEASQQKNRRQDEVVAAAVAGAASRPAPTQEGNADVSERQEIPEKAKTQDGAQGAQEGAAASAAEPTAGTAPAAAEVAKPAADWNRKQIPAMTDDELRQAIAHYGPEHKRTPKLQKALEIREAKAAPVAEEKTSTKATPLQTRVRELMYEGRDTALNTEGRLAIDMMDLEEGMTDAEFDQKTNGTWQDGVGIPLSEADTRLALDRVNGMTWHHGSPIADLGRLKLRSNGALFLSSDEQAAQHYAGDAGRVYPANVQVKAPFFVASSDLTADMESSGEQKALAKAGYDAIVPLDYADLVVLSESALVAPAPAKAPALQARDQKIAAAKKAAEPKPAPAEQAPAPTQEAPGTRANGVTERAAADRLESLLNQMPATMKPRAQGARNYVKSVVAELRREKTAVSVVENLETASQRFLSDGHAPFSDVIDEVIDSLQGKAAPAAAPAPAADRFAGNKLFTSDAVEKARARMKSKLGTLNSGIDPELMMDGITIAGAYIEAGVRSFTDYSAAMLADLGDGVRPYLRSFYEGVRHYPGLDTKGMTSAAEIDALEQAESQAAPAESETRNPSTLDEFIGAVDAGYRAHYDYAGTNGSTVWIEKTEKGWVMKSRDDGSTVTNTKGGVGLSAWDKLSALKAAERAAEYRFNEWKPVAKTETKANTTPTVTEDTPNDSTDPTSTPALDNGVDQGQRPAGSDANARGVEQPRARPGRADADGLRESGGRAEGNDDAGRDVGNGGRADQLPDAAPAAVERGTERVSADFQPAVGGLTREGSWLDTARRNIDLIELARKIESEGRPATADEQAQLSKYVGFGAGAIRNKLFPIPPSYAKQNDPDRLIWPNLIQEASWRALAERMEALPREWQKSVLQSSQYAHYTSEGIIRSVWSGMQRLGFTGGKILEPGMGIGSFSMLMPQGVRATSRYTGVEFDGPTALIARLLQPEQNMLHDDFIKRKFPRDFFDVAIGNPPFSQTQVFADPDYEKHGFMLHDFFFAKSIDRVRPGGLLAFVTSKGTMDKQTDKARKFLAARADLVGAIRLPSTAFEGNAGTSVVTDVIFLRKRKEGEAPAGEAWNGVATVDTKDGPVVINEYFAKHPEMVLGQNRISGNTDDHGRRINSNGRGGDAYTVVSYDSTPAELDAKFAAAVERLPQNVYSVLEQSPAAVRRETAKVDFDPSVKREGVVYVGKDGEIMRVEQGVGRPLAESMKMQKADAAWFAGYVSLRDLVNEARLAQATDGNWEKALKKLNKAYDEFRAEHGPINDFTVRKRKVTDEDGNEIEVESRSFKNRRRFREDYDAAILTQLETINEAGEIVKSPFLKGRTIGKPVSRDVKTIGDALAVSLDSIGRLDLDDVGTRIGLTRDEAINALGDQVYKTPSGQWQLSDEYLAGDVVTKLEEAEQAARLDPSLRRNVAALKAVQPEKLGPSQISAKLGSSWIPVAHVNEFAKEIEAGAVSFDPKTETWQVDGGNLRSQRRAGAEYGTALRSPSELLEAALNSRSIKIVNKIDGKQVTDQEGTTAANEALKKIKDKFKGWVWTDAERATELVESYNKRFNNIAPRRFDGSHLTLPGVSLRFKLHPHQLRAIWRIIQTGDTYLNHAVGAGKTIEMIAAGMEQKRLGLIKKPIYVVPNHMLEQFSNEFMELYPLANIMVADDENFSAERRKAFVASATMNNPDAVIITHDAFQRIGVKEESVAPIRDEILADLEIELSNTAKDNGARVRRSQLEQQIEAVTQRFERIIGAGGKDSTIKFEDIGVDMIFADEAHVFRKLDFHTSQQIKGIDPNGSKRALDMYVKTRILAKRQPGRSMVFASGTPVTNTMGELYTIMRFFAQDELDRGGISTFDAWARQFGEVAPALEPNAAGKYELIERFAKFDNVPELMSRVRQFMDVLTSEHLGALVKRPDLIGGKPNLNIVQPSPDLQDYMKGELARRIEISKAWKPSPDQPNNPDPIVSIITDGRFAAIDPRFFGGELGEEGSILTEMAGKVVASYHAGKDNVYLDKNDKPEPTKGSTQVVFYNLGFGEQSMSNRGFNSRDAFTKLLTAGGIKREHIAWFDDADSDAKKEAVFKDMRSGKLRVLIGSAKKMGTGVNVQKRLAVLHYQDPPWFPADVEQPHGRIIRQGNQNKDVAIEWYTTKGTYQSTMWQMVARKQRFIDQAFSGDKNLRTMEDMGEASLFEQAAAVASGDPRAIQLAGLKQDVERFERLQAAHASEQINVRSALRSAEWNIESAKARIATYGAAFKVIGEKFYSFSTGKVGKAVFDKVGEFGQAVKDAFNQAAGAVAAGTVVRDRVIGYLGDNLPVTVDMETDTKNAPTGELTLYVNIGGVAESVASGKSFGADVDAVGLGRRIVNQVNGVSTVLNRAKSDLKSEETDVVRLRKKQGAPFEYQQEMAEKYGELKRLEEELRLEGLAKPETPVVITEAGTMAGETSTTPPDDTLRATIERRKRTVEVDGVRRPIYDANGNLVAPDFDSQMEFWRTFKGEVDEQGHPIIDGDVTPRAGETTGSEIDRLLVAAAGKGTAADKLLGIIERNSANPEYRELARTLRNQGLKTTVQAGRPKGTYTAGVQADEATASYRQSDDTAFIHQERGAEEGLLHELAHAATLAGLQRGGLGAQQIKALWRHVKDRTEFAGQYGIRNEEEFIAEAYANPTFRQKLADTPAPGAALSMWQKLVAIVRILLGKPAAVSNNTLQRVMEAGTLLMQENQAAKTDGATTPNGELRASIGGSLGAGLQAATLTDLAGKVGNRLKDFRNIGLQALGRRQLVDLYARDFAPTGKESLLKRYSDLVQQMDADKNEAGAEADGIADRWGKVADRDKLAELMHDATLAKIDPAKDHQAGDNRMEWMKLQARHKALSPEAQKLYAEARDAYHKHWMKVRAEIRNRISRAMPESPRRAALLEKMDATFYEQIKGVYFPLARFGDYVVTVQNAAGERAAVHFAETMNEAEALRKALLKDFPASSGNKVSKITKKKEFNAGRDAVSRGFMQELFGVLDQYEDSAQLQDDINQLYLQSMPDLSWTKHGIHRKGTPGFSQDARRAFAQNMFHGARYLAKLRYGDRLADFLDEMQDHVSAKAADTAYDSVKAQQVVDEMVKRHEAYMSPNGNPLSTALTSIGFVFYLGLSPASAAVNLSQTPLVTLPMLAAKYGFGKASAALLEASKQAAQNKNDISKALRGDELAAYNEAIAAGVIDVSMAHDLAGIAAGDDTKTHAKLRPVMKWASWMFHHGEKFNRQATLLAAYRLAKGAGMDHAAAYKSAVDEVYASHFDYSSGNRARVMQGNVARVVLLFKQYAQNMIYTLTRNAVLAAKGDKVAQKTLAGLLLSHAMAAGVLGLPVVGTLLAAATMLGSDDDEPWDARVALRNALADMIGQKPAEVLMHGVSRLGPFDISGRVGLDKLILPDVQEGLEGARAAESWMTAALGPVAGIGLSGAKGLASIAEGDYLRGLESMLPVAVRNPIKALRYNLDGVKDKTGIPIVADTSELEEFGQLIGFSPSSVREAMEGKGAVYRADRKLADRRQALIEQWAHARQADDSEGMAELREEIEGFNSKNPGRRITMPQLVQSLRMRNKRIRESEDGVYLPRKRQDVRDLGRFAEQEE